MTATDEDVVRGFLLDVRSGERLERAGSYLAPLVTAHQGRPGAVHDVVVRSPDEYADHVRQMLRDLGPWTFELRTLQSAGGLVDATWRQTGVVGPAEGRTVVEHGQAAYRVVDGRVSEYWIEFRHETEEPR